MDADLPSVPRKNSVLSAEESREIVTPYAFAITPELLGVPLASPLRRGVAMLIDAIIISALASATLVVMIPLLIYLTWLRLKVQRYGQVSLLILTTLIAIYSAEFAPNLLFEESPPAQETYELDAASAAQFALAGITLLKENCTEGCVIKELKSLRRILQKNNVPRDEAKELLAELLAKTSLPAPRQDFLLESVLKHYPMSVATAEPQHPPSEQKDAWYMPDQETKSVLQWLQGILEDLGIGFGWAVFYFSCLVGWSNGQTIGKKLLQIRIVRLDGGKMDWWQAFNRQGGYGAGFATGLLGFLQIFWDPNRQAIQDKVSGTVVIQLHRPKKNITAVAVQAQP